MNTALRWTSADLELLPDDGKLYEIIDGELLMSRQPHYHHQLACNQIAYFLTDWNRKTGLGQTVSAPGILFDDDDDVAPDVVWCSYKRLEKVLGDDGKLHGAPELVIEVLSPGSINERRDRQAKLKLYSRRGIEEYWILDWMSVRVEVFRRRFRQLKLIETLNRNDTLKTPLLPGFSCPVAELFDYPPANGHKKNGSKTKTK